ncbi:hypothetical protein HYW74_00510 [Candidatus Pacearchaeota archaeon]|nr:hypothetical protein [Candidatus Pacearchaeota archaeon]
MDSFIKKVFDGKTDNLVHMQFQKFSKGEFRDKALVSVNKIGNRFSIGTTYEYANELVRSAAEKLKNGEKTKVTGVIVSTRDLKGQLEFDNIKQFMGVKQYIINHELSKEEILGICDKFSTSFIGLSFSAGDTELKIKAKAPKSAKPSTSSDKAPSADFCKLKTLDIELVRDLLFDVTNFESIKKIFIRHDFIITDIDIPKNEKDPAKMREMAIRKGKIIRKIDIDGRETLKEIKFEA